MYVDEILKNYNELGTKIIETIYTDGYLSIGGKASTTELAEFASVTSSSRILDIGSGVGGPARHLAATFGCQVTGIDLVEANVEDANQRAKAEGVELLATFMTGDALNLPFEDQTFDIVWGQDAWCHIPDKEQLITQAHRVLVPGGCVAFTDWVETGPMSADERKTLLSAMAAPNTASIDDYRRYLSLNGFSITTEANVSEVFTSQYREIMMGLEDARSAFIERYSAKIYKIVAERNAIILDGFARHALGGVQFVAHKY